MLKYSVLNNMLRRMKKYAEVFSKISAEFNLQMQQNSD